MTKSKDRVSDLVNGRASRPYNKAGMHLLLIGTGQRGTMPYDWEGNHRSGVALAMRHRLYLGAQWPTEGR